jgi:hypothetical protein
MVFLHNTRNKFEKLNAGSVVCVAVFTFQDINVAAQDV